MKKLVFVVALIALAVGGSAFAQTAFQNNIGVYFDAEGTITTNNDGVAGVKHCYVVLTDLTTPTVDGFECKLTATGGMIIAYATQTFPAELAVINVGTRYGEVIAGFGFPLPVVDGRAMVMEFDIFVTDPGVPGELFLSPTYFSSLPGTAAFLYDHVIYEANNSTAPGLPVLVTNSTEEPVATQATSLDNLKSLYR